MDELKRWRRELHQIPELGLKEYQTASYIRHELEKMGYVWESIIDTGTIVYIDQGQNETIAFRSDIDGLPINEENDISFCSTHSGVMHACGHDGHMSALLGFAKKLKQSKVRFPCNILLIFQPAEESPGGAKFIVESEVLEKYHVKSIYGMHLMPSIDEGVIACKPGPLMAMCGELDVMIKGKGSHAGLPHLGVDSIVIASQLISQYQSLVSRMISPFDPIVLNIGSIQGGTARNSVASQCELHGTLRCYSEDVFQQMTSHISKIHQGLQDAYGCEIEWSCPPMYPPVINDLELYQKLVPLVEEKYLEIKEPLMLAEDFSYYQKAVKGVFFYLGTKCDEYQSGLHTETFNFHEEVLIKAVNLYYQLALQGE